MKRKLNEKGITLLALVITIIVLLILAAVGVKLALGDGGVLDEARQAANEWDKAAEGEQTDLSKLAQEMRNVRNGIYNGTSGGNLGNEAGGNQNGGGDIGDTNLIEGITGNETTNTETTDKEGNRVVVPAGFKVVNPEDTVNDGIVIEDVSANNEDTVGNQFVWIPCTLDGSNRSLKYDRYAFTRESPAWDNKQSLILGTNGEYEKATDGSYKIVRVKEKSYYYREALSEDERSSIEKYGGYYFRQI